MLLLPELRRQNQSGLRDGSGPLEAEPDAGVDGLLFIAGAKLSRAVQERADGGGPLHRHTEAGHETVAPDCGTGRGEGGASTVRELGGQVHATVEVFVLPRDSEFGRDDNAVANLLVESDPSAQSRLQRLIALCINVQRRDGAGFAKGVHVQALVLQRQLCAITPVGACESALRVAPSVGFLLL